MLKHIFLLAVWAITLSLQAGPKGYFRTEKGALIRGEVLYADNNFYYYRRVSGPDEILTVKIENVPVSFKRIVNNLCLKNEITLPPESIAQKEGVGRSHGKWQVRDLVDSSGDDHVHWYFATLETKDDRGQVVKLVVRYCYNECNRRSTFDVYLEFDNRITMMPRCQVTYQFDSEEPIIERWKKSINSSKALFSNDSYNIRDKLFESDDLSFLVNDMTNETRRFNFLVSHFRQVYEDSFEPSINGCKCSKTDFR